MPASSLPGASPPKKPADEPPGVPARVAGRGLVGKAWDSLTRKGPIGLGRDVRDYLRWRLAPTATPDGGAVVQAPPSNWDLNQEELRTLPEVLRSRPILLYAESTSRCNLHCFMCRLSFPESTRRTRQHMSLDTFARLEPLLEPGSRLSLFGLGEPLLNPNFVEMLRIAKQRGVYVGLNSNAMLLTERIARAMVDLEQDLLVISFSGGTRETYERVITGASYDRVLANLRRLNEVKEQAVARHQAPGQAEGTGHKAQGDGEGADLTPLPPSRRGKGESLPLPLGEGRGEGCPSTLDSRLSTRSTTPLEQVKPVLQLQFTAMRDNVRELPEAVRLAVDLSCAGAVVMPLTVVDPSLAEQSILNPELRPQVEESFEAARRVAASAGYPFDLQLPVRELLRAWQAPGTRHQAPDLCYEPWQTFYLRDDGTVNTCCYSNRVLGDLKEQTALEVWNGERYRRFRARMRSENKPAECRVCHKLRGDDWYDQRVDEETFYDEL